MATDKRTDSELSTVNMAFSSLTQAALGYYKTIFTVASAFLGGSMLFLERIAPNPSGLSLVFLAAGWFVLIIAVISIALVQRDNLRSGRQFLEGKIPESVRTDNRSSFFSTLSIVCLAIGLLAITTFGFINLL